MVYEKTDTVSIWPYVGIYMLVTFLVSVALIALAIIFPSFIALTGKNTYFGVNFASTLTAYSLFIRKHGRTFHRGEYWKTVVFSTIAIILFSMLFLLLSLADHATAAKLRGIPFGGWVAIMALATLFAFCLNALGYSSWFGNRMLKANRKRQTQLDTKPFR
jgi:hypothetical protein